MCLDRRDPALQIPMPNGRRADDVTVVQRTDRRQLGIIVTVRDPTTGQLVRLTRPDYDTDMPVSTNR
jgi:hypothetical protein